MIRAVKIVSIEFKKGHFNNGNFLPSERQPNYLKIQGILEAVSKTASITLVTASSVRDG